MFTISRKILLWNFHHRRVLYAKFKDIENKSDLPFLSFCRGDKLQITGFFVSERKSYA